MKLLYNYNKLNYIKLMYGGMDVGDMGDEDDEWSVVSYQNKKRNNYTKPITQYDVFMTNDDLIYNIIINGYRLSLNFLYGSHNASERQRILANTQIIHDSKKIIKYKTGYQYTQYEANIYNLKLGFSLKKLLDDSVQRIEEKKDTRQIQYVGSPIRTITIYIDKYLMKRFMDTIGAHVKRMTRHWKEIQMYQIIIDNARIKQYAILPYHFRYIADDDNLPCDVFLYEFVYYIPIFDTSIRTIFNFTTDHIPLLKSIKDDVMYILKRDRPECFNENNEKKIRIYTLFPARRYNYPVFFVDVYDDTNTGFIRADDMIRTHYIDDIINILEAKGNMNMFYISYNVPLDSMFLKLAQTEFRKTLSRFFPILLNGTDIFNENILTQDCKVLRKKIDILYKNVRYPNRYDAFGYESYLANPNNYKYLHLLWKCYLLGNTNQYSFITQYGVLGVRDTTYIYDLPENLETKQPDTKQPDTKQSFVHPVQEPDEDEFNLTDYFIICSNPDFTKDDNFYSNYWFGLLCYNRKKNTIEQLNFEKRRVIGDTANKNNFTLIGDIEEYLKDMDNERYQNKLNIKKTYTDNSVNKPIFYGKGINNSASQFFVDIHVLDLVGANESGIAIEINERKILYVDTKYKKTILLSYRRTSEYSVETQQMIDAKKIDMMNIKLDGKNLNMFSFMQYRYVGENPTTRMHSFILRTIIAKRECKNIYFRKYILFNPYLPFIAIPDEKFIEILNNNPNQLTQVDIYNCDWVIWYCAKDLYDTSLIIPYGKFSKTIQEIISKLKPGDTYPFDKEQITKPDNKEFPHIFRYASTKLLDELFIFVNYFCHRMFTDTTGIINNASRKYFKNPNNFDTYFHNAKVSQSVLHLHITSKLNKKQLSERHVSNNFSQYIRALASINLWTCYMEKINNIQTLRWDNR